MALRQVEVTGRIDATDEEEAVDLVVNHVGPSLDAVLTDLLGYPGVRNDDGTWTEYGSLVGVSVERGASAR
jgi:hypothetical protein